MNVVETDNLRKSYGSLEVLHGIDLRVPPGSLFGFLGPNGAGKSTAIRVLLGLLRASGGRASVLGQDCWQEGPSLRARVGHLPGDIRFWDQLSGRRTLAFLARARGNDCVGEITRLAEVFALDLDRRVRAYSRGMKQKLGLIQALMHRPEVLILDEPTVSLDPLVCESLYEELRRVAGEGRTVLFSSHVLSEVEHLCDWVAILRDGRIIEQDRIETLRGRAVRRVQITFEPGAVPDEAPSGLHVTGRAENRLTGGWTGPIDELLRWLAAAAVTDVEIAPPDLEDLFMAYYAQHNHGEEARP